MTQSRPADAARALLVLALSVAMCGCLSSELQTGLTEPEAQEIIVLLKQNGIAAYPVRAAAAGADHNAAPAWTVRVKGGDRNVVAAWQVLQENGLPRQRVKGLEEVFSGGGMIPTAGEEKARLLLALSGEMSRMLKAVSGVVDARVQVVLPENSPLLDRSQWSPPTASVLVKYRGGQPPLSEDEVKRLVSRGIEGLQPDNVAIVYKKVPAAPQAARDVGWYLSDAYVVAAALALMLFASLGSLVLIFRGRRQKATIEALKRQLESSRPQQLSAAESGR
ncbi:MAG TPA: hypothetical protein VN428_04545 [Bryobacteraceae bacterium]|nr:hypothetical protein [Bryobacteraceae bacterium]